MGTDVIVLNGGSSSGKSSIARHLQTLLPSAWLTLGVDNLIEAMPRQATGRDIGIIFDPDGLISVGQAFRQVEAAWNTGLAAMARAGVGVIIDEVFLGAAASQARLESALAGLEVLWVGVYCHADVAAAREVARQNRVRGMAAAQAGLVHSGVHYDIEIDTSHRPAMDCARQVFERVIG